MDTPKYYAEYQVSVLPVSQTCFKAIKRKFASVKMPYRTEWTPPHFTLRKTKYVS